MTDPTTLDRGVIELRRYTLRPGARETLIELFERELLETQEACGMAVLGQFRDLDEDDRFVWLRGFADMAARPAALADFYGGPAWRAHREAANATMIDSDDVLLLRPAWAGACDAMRGHSRAPLGATATPAGFLLVTLLHLAAPAGAEGLALCRDVLVAAPTAAGAEVIGCFVNETAANNFARLPVREGEHVVAAFAWFDDRGAGDIFVRRGVSPGAAATALSRLLIRPIEHLRLAPTPRSAIHAGAKR
jgi:NIPSNAP protein